VNSRFNILESQIKEIELQRQEIKREYGMLATKKKQIIFAPFSAIEAEKRLFEISQKYKKDGIKDIIDPGYDIELQELLGKDTTRLNELNTQYKEYIDATIQELEAEKEEYRIMRQKYENLLSMERDLHKHKIELEEKSNKFQHLMLDFKSKISTIFDNYLEIVQIRKGKCVPIIHRNFIRFLQT
jgi:sugar-specific transcriptional regulator TrmB